MDKYQETAEEFFREGCVLVPGVFNEAEVELLRSKTDDYYHRREEIPARHASYAGTAFVLRNCADLDPVYKDSLSHDPIPALVEAVLGPQPRFNALNVIRNEPGAAISTWHVDDVVEFPLPDDIPRFDPRIRMPVFWFTVQVALSDIDTLENGPTQFVPTSHYSGRRPYTQDEPRFEGNGPKEVYCKAGDIYFTNHQAWHRGAPNTSNRTRYVMQLQFAQRWADSRFKGTS
jgi:ectoine hydroxylase-related dioxygenase (phytanoyl-CoA dioxygenase family)